MKVLKTPINFSFKIVRETSNAVSEKYRVGL